MNDTIKKGTRVLGIDPTKRRYRPGEIISHVKNGWYSVKFKSGTEEVCKLVSAAKKYGEIELVEHTIKEKMTTKTESRLKKLIREEIMKENDSNQTASLKQRLKDLKIKIKNLHTDIMLSSQFDENIKKKSEVLISVDRFLFDLILTLR